METTKGITDAFLKAKELIPGIDYFITGTAGIITLNGVLLFSTNGPATAYVLEAYFVGLYIGKKL